MSSVESAITAKTQLDGKEIFNGCCLLRIGYSNLKDLNVKNNGPKSRDFSLPDSSGASMSAYPPQPYLMQSPGYGQQAYGQSAPSMGGQNMFGMQSAGFGAGFGAPPQAQAGYGRYGGGGYDKQAQFGGAPFAGSAGGAVLLVSNLVPEHITPDKLFVLFGVYGDVYRVKILFKKPGTALIQMATADQASQALRHLNRLNLWGKDLAVSVSKFNEIALPINDEKSDLTKDFSSSPIHRFKNRAERSLKNLNSPSEVLHVSNLAEGTNESQLRALFEAEQTHPPVVHFFKNDRKMAYVRMESVQSAVTALMSLHNHKLGDRYMRISFSNKDPSTVQDSEDSA